MSDAERGLIRGVVEGAIAVATVRPNVGAYLCEIAATLDNGSASKRGW